MQVDVHYTTQLRTALNRSQETVEVPHGTTVKQLLTALSAKYPDAFGRLVCSENQQLLPNLILTVGDQQVRDLDQPLNDGDSIMLLSAISGG